VKIQKDINNYKILETLAGNLEYLQKSAFLCIVNHYQDAVWLMEKTVILATRSDAVDFLNKEPLKI
jgi:hypothetical protein